jgi:hypothetical protein
LCGCDLILNKKRRAKKEGDNDSERTPLHTSFVFCGKKERRKV